MGETGKRMEQLGIALPVKDRRGTGAVDAVLTGDLLFLSAHLPVDAQGKAVYAGKVGVALLLPLWRKAQVHARIRDED